MIFCRAVSFRSWLETFGRESRCRFWFRSSRAARTRMPCRCRNSSTEKACRSSLRRPVRRCRRSEEHTSELQSLAYLVCRLLLEKKKKQLVIILPKKKKKQ